jgi:hypothetical protein
MKVIIYNDQVFDNEGHLISAKIKTKKLENIEELKWSLVGEIAERVDVELSLTKNNLNYFLEFINNSQPAFK